MNLIDKHPDYKRIYESVVKLFKRKHYFCSGPLDETFYSMRVYETTKIIINKIKQPLKKELLLTASILHDCGKSRLKMNRIFKKNELLSTDKEEWGLHPIKGVPVAKKILKELGHSNEFIKEISYLIKEHDNRELQNKTIELKILQDADLVGDMGLADFIRPFLWGGKFNQQIIESIKFMIKERQAKDINKLNLEISKKMAEIQYKIKEDLIKQISELINTNLID